MNTKEKKIILDSVDKKIISILKNNARNSVSNIAEEINLSIPATSDRIKKMEDMKVIIGYKAVIDSQKVGLDILALITIISESSTDYGKIITYGLTADCDFPATVSGQNITNVTISADLGREAMYKLGEFAPHHRFTNFPLEITCEIEVSATGLDQENVDIQNVTCTGGGVPGEEPIKIVLCDPATGGTSYQFDLGDKCAVQSVNYQGGDTGGGNATISYSYITYNELDITG